MDTPLISVITATYNCSHLLRHAIQSVLDSDFQDWELIVIGDCCTDDSEEVVNGFSDDRISFYNLEKNSGQQAKPNNYGLEKAKGNTLPFSIRMICFSLIIFPDLWRRSRVHKLNF